MKEEVLNNKSVRFSWYVLFCVCFETVSFFLSLSLSFYLILRIDWIKYFRLEKKRWETDNRQIKAGNEDIKEKKLPEKFKFEFFCWNGILFLLFWLFFFMIPFCTKSCTFIQEKKTKSFALDFRFCLVV